MGQGVSPATIQKCWWKSTIIKKPEDQVEQDIATQDQRDRDELQAQIAQLPITNPLPVDEFIQLDGEVIKKILKIAEESEIFEQIVERYGIAEEDTIELAEDAVGKRKKGYSYL